MLNNHPAPHIAVLTAAQITAGSEITIDIQGEAFHSHTITVTAEMLKQLAQKNRISVESTVNPHSNGSGDHKHTVIFG